MVRLASLILLIIPLLVFGQNSDTLVWEDEFGNSYLQGSFAYNYCVNNGIEHPFTKEHSDKINSLEHTPHVLNSKYNFTGSRAILRCNKVYTFCAIRVNGQLVLETNNAFHPWEVDITNFLNNGENEIEAIFTPSILKGLENVYSYTHPAPNDIHNPQIASLVRKPQFMFGWDWAPRTNLMGFLDVVKIESKKELFKNPFVRLLDYNDGKAIIERSIEVVDTSIRKVLWQIGEEENWFEVKFGSLVYIDTLVDAVLWKPGQINELYKEKWRLRNKRFELYKNVKYGLRKVKLIQDSDSIGTPFYFKVNNNFVFCKGANLVPLDVFPEKVDNQKMKNLVFDAYRANMNMLRVWGGGDYLPEYFYSLCDSLGIMVWQDFMFACAMYPNDSSFLKNVENEALYQIKRLRQHPSVIYFNGNNEVDVAWKNWGFQSQSKYNLTKKAQEEIEQGYDKLFKKLLARIVHENSDIPYEHTSPLSNWGAAMNFNHGTMHYWGVWHGKDSLQEFWKQSGRFNAEFGFQSFPSPFALSQIASKEHWSLSNSAIQARQKSYVGSAKIEEFIKREYGGTTDFSDFVYKSQLVQSKGVGGALMAHRLKSPACGGSLFWQLNDCWAAPTWSAIDFYGERKALYYSAKEVFANQTIIRNPNQPSDFYLLQDDNNPSSIEFSLNYYSFDGEKLDSVSYTVTDELKQKLPVDTSRGDILLILSEQKTYTFIINDFKGKSSIDKNLVELTKLTYDNDTRKGLLIFEVESFVAHLQFYSEKYPLIFAENFQHFLPGTYSVEFELRKDAEEITLEDIQYHYIHQ